MARYFILSLIRLFNFLSFKISRTLKASYQLTIPFATYAPWLKDEAFLKNYDLIKGVSLVNIYQCWELWKLVDETEKTPGDVIEVGVFKGATSAIMGAKLKQNHSPAQFICCDTFEGVVKASAADNFYKGGEHKDTSLGFVTNLLTQTFQLNNVVFLKGIFPDETGHQVQDSQFRLCHIDVDTYQSGKEVLNWVWERLSPGGIVVFNDFGYPRTRGITQLVEENRGRKDCLVIHNLNGHGMMIKLK